MSKLARRTPFTPTKRQHSSSPAGDNGSIANAHHHPLSSSRFPTINDAPTSHAVPTKKIRAALSSESRTRSTASSLSRPGSVIGTAPGTPKKNSVQNGPGTPRRNPNGSSVDLNAISDPEEGLVDFQNVEVDPDVSCDAEDVFTTGGGPNSGTSTGKEDKVLVSIRIRPSELPLAWVLGGTNSTANEPIIKVKQEYSRTGGNVSQEFRFDNVITPSTSSKSVYASTAKDHVRAAMEGYNAVVFAYGQTASGKTFTLTGNDDEPGIIPRAMRDVFGYIKATPSREFLLRCSYLEIYNETIHDLLSLSGTPVGLQGGIGNQVVITPLREEVVTSLKSVREVIQRGEANRRTASTDWNERSSRSHSVFRLVIESRERGNSSDVNALEERKIGMVPQTPGGSRLQAKGGRSVRTSMLSLIDLAGSEKATSDKERAREGKYINTSLLNLGSVIGTLAENHAKGRNDHVPYRNSKLTRMLQPSLSGDARISVICTLNPDPTAVGESTNTLLFAQRVKKVHLNATKKEVMDTDALIERYRKEIEELKRRLEEREREAPTRNRRLSAREQVDESRAMGDLNARIKQLTKLILTSQTVDENNGDKSRPSSPSKLDFDLSPYQLQQELLAARRELETQATQILSLEAALESRPLLPPDAPESDKDKLIVDQARAIKEYEIVVRGYEQNLGEPLRAVREDVENEWKGKLEEERKTREEKEVWATELVRQLEREKQIRQKLEEEKRALVSFVTDIDGYLRLNKGVSPNKISNSIPFPSPAGPNGRRRSMSLGIIDDPANSPIKLELSKLRAQPSLLEQMPEEEWENYEPSPKGPNSKRTVLGDKENIPLGK